MVIKDLRLGIIRVPLRTPFKTALRQVTCVEDVVVQIITDTEHVGFGEAPPTKAITGETIESIVSTINEYIKPAIIGKRIEDFEEVTKLVQSCCDHNTSAKACVDMALWDLYGKMMNQPVYQYLSGTRKHIVTDITISLNEPDEMVRDALSAVSRGYKTLKIKLGNDVEKDMQRLLAVRNAVGENIDIRIDANQGWTAQEAVEIIEQMQSKGINLEFVEQPVKAHDLEGLKYVTEHSEVPILADESVFGYEDAKTIIENHMADLINIKLMKCGGITPALEICDLAKKHHVECMIGCMLEAKIAVNAAVEVACSRDIITKIDLDGPLLCSEDPIIGGAIFDEKDIYVCNGTGLGIRGIQPDSYTKIE